jgi:hypothetical protein
MNLPAPVRPRRLFALLLLAAVLPGACDSYNLSLKEFFTESPGAQADEGRTGKAALSVKAITAFSIGGAAGTIDEGAKTITLTAPSGTVLNNLTPAITHTGAGISPALGEAQDFTHPVIYTVTAEDGSTAVYRVTVTVRLGTVAELAAYLEAAANGSAPTDPVIPPPLELNLVGMASDWTNLLNTIQAKGKHVSLDLSACTSNATFSPGAANTGKDKIVSLVLPDTATSIADGTESTPTFQHFSSLKSVSGENTETIGSSAFRNCPALTTVDFPNATTINGDAFHGCTALTSVNLPEAETIGIRVFNDCSSLTSVNFPKATTITAEAFRGCTALTTLYLPLAETIGAHTFNGCTALTLVNLPQATTIGYQTFDGCTSLTSVDLPLAETIGGYTFNGCTALTSVNLPKAISINYGAFAITGMEDLTVTLGSTPPSLEEDMFAGLSSAKSVTVKVPPGATGYGGLPGSYSGTDNTNNWGNAFRGKGWDGTNYLTGTVKASVALTITTL